MKVIVCDPQDGRCDMNNGKAMIRMVSALFMVLIMVAAMIPASAVEVFADDGTGQETAQTAAEEQSGAAEQADTDEQSGAAEQDAAGSDKTANFHAAITSEKDRWSSGVTAIYSVDYTIDQRSVKEGDYVIVTVPEDIVSSVDLAVSSQHFSKKEDLGGGRYKLTFAEKAESALTGSFTMNLTMNNDTDFSKSGQIIIGDAAKDITVDPVSHSTGSGEFTDAINKDATENDDVSYGGYDYSDGAGSNAKQIGVISADSDGRYAFRLFINRKKGDLSNIHVTDSLPGGMHFDSSKAPEVYYWRDRTEAVDPSKYSVSTSDGRLDFSYDGDLCGETIMVKYYVTVDNFRTAKYTNIAEISYTENGSAYSEHSGYVLKGSSYSAANGEKMVSKTVITDAATDQHVMYSFKFWNNNVIEKGKINFIDELNPYLDYESAIASDYFEITRDKDDPQKIHITNKKDLPANQTLYARFMVDMSRVPEGSIVSNTAGGNTVYTFKKFKKSPLDLSASKTLDGKAPGKDHTFSFELTDESGKVIQTKKNDADGNILFDAFDFDSSDVGRTLKYYVVEKKGTDASIDYDETKYEVDVAVSEKTDEKSADTKIVTPEIKAIKNVTTGETVNSITFSNKTSKTPETPKSDTHKTTVTPEKTSVSGTKTWVGVSDGEKVPDITIDLLRDGSKTDSTVLRDGEKEYSFDDLDKYDPADGHEYKYTVKEEPVDGYTSKQDGFNFTNTKTEKTPAHPDQHEETPAVVPAELKLEALKTVDGKAPGTASFKFDLKDENGSVLQTVTNDQEGNIIFSPISYDESDCGKTFTYTVSEQQDASKTYRFDSRVYKITVTPSLDTATGRITAEPEITLDGSSAEKIVFNNTTIKDSKVTPSGGNKRPADSDKTNKTNTNGKSGKHVSGRSSSKTSAGTGRTVKASEIKTPSTGSIPRTGDTSEASIYAAAGIAAAALAAAMLVFRRRRRADR
jgi:pilin isopeptide linkage protein/LPXTG-motif cell wall-anchored protein